MSQNEKTNGIVHPSQRVGVFVDVQNLYHSSKHLYNARVNFDILLKTVVSGRPLIRAVAYVVRSDSVLTEMDAKYEATGEESFFEVLRNTGLELRVKDLQVFAGGAKKADWDVGMAVDAIRMANFLDVVILVTGDGDFVPLIEYLKWGMGRQVEVAAFEKATSSRLKESADGFITLDNTPRIFLGRRGKRKKRE
jgi:uncharacterized LabA/DUF88 family protein